MKKIFLATLIFIYSMICMNVNATQYINDEINKTDIERIVVNVPSIVKIYPGDSIDLNIRTYDKDLYDNIKYEIHNKILYINLLDQKYLEDQLVEPDDVRINIQVPNNVENIGTDSYLLVATVNKNNKATNYGKN